MPRINPVDRTEARGRARQLLDEAEARWGMTTNSVRGLAKAPAALEGFLRFSDALDRGVLPAPLREQIAIAVAEAAGSSYCLASQCALGKAAGLSEDEIMDARRGESPDRKTEVVLQFAWKLVQQRGCADDYDVSQLRDAGYDDQHITEIIANVALGIFDAYFNQVAGTELDFPHVRQLAGA